MATSMLRSLVLRIPLVHHVLSYASQLCMCIRSFIMVNSMLRSTVLRICFAIHGLLHASRQITVHIVCASCVVRTVKVVCFYHGQLHASQNCSQWACSPAQHCQGTMLCNVHHGKFHALQIVLRISFVHWPVPRFAAFLPQACSRMLPQWLAQSYCPPPTKCTGQPCCHPYHQILFSPCPARAQPS